MKIYGLQKVLKKKIFFVYKQYIEKDLICKYHMPHMGLYRDLIEKPAQRTHPRESDRHK